MVDDIIFDEITFKTVETGATVEPFGSFASNLFTKWGDLDISIELQNGTYISSPGKKHKQSVLQDVLKAFTKKGGFRKLKFIANSRVPILKGSYNISCDISINNLSGQMKSNILFWINEIDGRFLVLLLHYLINFIIYCYELSHQYNPPLTFSFIYLFVFIILGLLAP